MKSFKRSRKPLKSRLFISHIIKCAIDERNLSEKVDHYKHSHHPHVTRAQLLLRWPRNALEVEISLSTVTFSMICKNSTMSSRKNIFFGYIHVATTLCSKNSNHYNYTALLIRINYSYSSFNYNLSSTNVANFNKIHRTVSEQQLFFKMELKNKIFRYEKYRLAYLLQEVLRIMTYCWLYFVTRLIEVKINGFYRAAWNAVAV